VAPAAAEGRPPTAGKGGSSAGTGGKGGTDSDGGTSGSAGTGGSGGSSGTGSMPAPDTGFSVQYQASNVEASSVVIACQFQITNGSNETVPLSEFTLRYYFTNELTVEPELQYFWGHITGGANFNFTLAQQDLSDGSAQADSYFEFTLAADAPMLAPGQTAELAWQSHNGQSQINLQSNDYSFDGTKTQYTDWEHVGLFRNGEPYWGAPP
jgi:hypothetical protein